MRRYRRRTRSQYLLPFLALITLGVFLILAFQLWGNFFPNAKGDAVYFLAEGRSKLLGFGTTDWENVYNGSKVKLGDSVKTLQSAKGVMTFYDGTVLRMAENTQITLLDISKKDDYQQILIYLNSGKIWVNKPKQNVIRKTDFVINTNFASYAITGTVFDLEKNGEEVLRVMRGQVQTDIIENADGKIRTIESIPVGIGQQTILNDAAMKEFYDRKSPSVLGATDPTFEESEWYKWNTAEDDHPTDFSKPGSAINTVTDENASGEISADAVINADTGSTKKTSTLEPPSLTSPKTTTLKITGEKQSLIGKASEGTKKVLLKQTLAGSDKVEKILINSFDEEALNWSYDLSVTKGNILPGVNTYEFVGVDENAMETKPLKVQVELTENATTISSVPLQKPKISKVDGKNYQEGMVLTKDGFAITGSVAGASELWVDDFKLNKFKAGDTTWSYNVKMSYGNLKEGANSYKVYAVDANGKKSEAASLKFTFNAPVAPVATTTDQPAT